MACAFKVMASPVGELRLFASGAGLRLSCGRMTTPSACRSSRLSSKRTIPCSSRRNASSRTDFDLPLAAEGADLRRKVWEALLAIPFGETRSYADIASSVGKPSAYRAVGAAIGMNPLSIVVPCHRVIGSNGALTGFAGGLDTKRYLLDHEARKAA